MRFADIDDRRRYNLIIERRRSVQIPVAAAMLGVASVLVVYARTLAFVYDEGFHLLAAQLILRGRRPYLDFFFPQTPLNAYWNALWMRLFGETWRVTHTWAALATAAAVLLTTDYVYRRLPDPRWRTPGAVFACLAFGLNVAVVEYATSAQSYALGLVLIVAAFRAAVAAVDRVSVSWTAVAGVFAGAAAAATLLTAPVAPVLLIWMLVASPARRFARVAAFVAAAAVPFAPVAWLFAQSPYRVLFNIVTFQIRYRQSGWTSVAGHDFDVALSWLDSGQALLLIALALFAARAGLKRELKLCVWLALAESAYLLTGHPTFSRYFLLTVPFLAILASAGLCAFADRVGSSPRTAAIIACCLIALALGKRVYEGRGDMTWRDVETIAAEVERVTPPGAALDADENVYFLTRRPPPSGLENAYSHYLKLSPVESSALHVLPRAELDRRVATGEFATLETCQDDQVDRTDIPKFFTQQAEIEGCVAYWQARRVAPQ